MNFDFTIPGLDDAKEPEIVTPPVRQQQPQVQAKQGGGSSGSQSSPDGSEGQPSSPRDVSRDMRDDALNATGSGTSAAKSDEDQAVRQAFRKSVSGGRKGLSDPDSLSSVKIPASLSHYAAEQLNWQINNRGEAVAAFLYRAFGGTVEAPERIKELARRIPVEENSELDMHAELEKLHEDNAKLVNQLKDMTQRLAESHSALIWLIGEKLGSPGTEPALGAQRMHINFSEAELIRYRIALQTKEHEVEVQVRRGREIEDQVFRNNQYK